MFLSSVLALISCRAPDEAIGPPSSDATARAPAGGWQSLFDGETLRGWRVTEFGGDGDVRVEDGRLILETGQPLTGVTWTGDLPRIDYEVLVDAARLGGTDFFCGLTFPVGDSHCSLILGGWGGSLTGLSSIDHLDASENETTRFLPFENGVTYQVRLRVTRDRIEAFVDGARIVDQPTAGRTISIRPEVALSRPFGLAAYASTAAVSAVRVRERP